MAHVLEIIRRRVRLAYAPERARRWTAMPRSTEDCLNALSSLFPIGEAFFCRSVARYRDRITDPILREQVAQFIYQEAMHSKEHSRANDALREANVLGQEIEAAGRLMIGFTERFLPPVTQLAVTCALEHCTTMLCAKLLTMNWPRAEGTDKEFGKLWTWHAAEEIEHKAVCFDVYEQIFGKGVLAWLHRSGAMLGVTIIGGSGLMIAYGVASLKGFMRQKRAVTPEKTPAERIRPSMRSIFASMSWKDYFDYYRRDFHPDMHDHRDLLLAWKRENPGFGMDHGPERA
jgi:predicted metal-dependent hydrolase